MAQIENRFPGGGDRFFRRTLLDANTLAQWRCDDPLGSIAVAEFRGLYSLGTLNGSPSFYETGEFSASIEFPVGAGAVGAPSLAPPQAAVTIDAWIRPQSSTANWQMILMRGYDAAWGPTHYESISLHMLANGVQLEGAVDLGAGEVLTNLVTIAQNVWHHVGLTYDGSNMRVYVDGELADTKAAVGAIDWGAGASWAIGNTHLAATDRFFSGRIEDARAHQVVRPLTYFHTRWQDALGGV